MRHPIHRVVGLSKLGEHRLEVVFDDGTRRVIDFGPVLRGEMLGPLADPEVFDRVELDPEAGTLVWPNGADFDPAMLHDWPEVVGDLERLAAGWTR